MRERQFTIRDLLWVTAIAAALAFLFAKLARTMPTDQPQPLIFVGPDGKPTPELDPRTGKMKAPAAR